MEHLADEMFQEMYNAACLLHDLAAYLMSLVIISCFSR